MKKYIVYISIFIVMISIATKIYADDFEEEAEDTSWIYEEIESASSNKNGEPTLNSRAVVVYDRNSKDIIWGKDENSRRKMASTTKIMTSIIVIENIKDLTQIVEISEKSACIGGSRLGLSKEDKITVNDLLYGLMMKSGNDCAIALAEFTSGSVGEFVKQMNNKAKELELTNTHFVTVNGLDEEEHYTTALELAKLTDYALNNKIFRQIVGTKNYNIRINGYTKNIGNTNELLGNLNGVYGVKTGFTNGANRCLVTAIKRDNMDLICVVLGADTKKDRTKDSINIIEYVFSNYQMINIEEKIKNAYKEWKDKNKIMVIKGIKQYAETEIKEYQVKEIPVYKQYINKIEVEIENLKVLNSPVIKGMKVGEIQVKVNKKMKLSIDLLTYKEIRKKNEKNYLYEILYNYKNYFEKITRKN